MPDRKVVWKLGGYDPEDQVEVPHPDRMDDETFIKHLEKRHAKECKIEGYVSRHNVRVWINMYRIFHARLHRIATPGQYDHVHRGMAVEEEEE